tara:strand:+ start:673 stop:1638 length:966 start_codon:yes stop_codon:yes gene_type:complete
MKVCSRKSCKREAGPKFKVCQRCRDSNKKSNRKRKRAAAEAVAKEGHRHCTNCSREFPITEGKFKKCQRCRDSGKKSNRKKRRTAAEAVAKEGYRHCTHCLREWPLEQFESFVNRRAKLTAWCATCRALQSKNQKSETSKVGQCKKLWEDWRDSHACLHCGTTDCIEADHLGEKVHECSDYPWWSWNGGVEALKKELAKVRPLCCFCHRVHTQAQRGISKNPTRAKKRRHVEAIKMRIGCCQVCQRKVTPETLCAFDFNHLDPETKRDDISRMVASYKLNDFFKYINPETELCDLECANCHKKHTRAQMKEITLTLQMVVD